MDLNQALPIRLNVSDDDFHSNIRSALKRGLPVLTHTPPPVKRALIVCGGPSLADSLPEIGWRHKNGQDIFACNGSAQWLVDRGINPRFQVILDARPSNARFVVPGLTHLIASQCHPDTFEAAGAGAIVWHPHVEGIHGHIGSQDCVLIGGGTTVGLQAMGLAYAMGYRAIHVFGMDSSFEADGSDHHAYPQPENDGEPVCETIAGCRKFYAAPWMVHQADQFENVCRQLTDCEITVAGRGLIPHVAKMLFCPETEALDVGYDLEKMPASYDFIAWLAMQKAEQARMKYGRLRVKFRLDGGFREDNFPGPGKERMLRSVMRPALALFGAEEGGEPDVWPGAYTIGAAPRLAAPRPTEDARRYVKAFLGDRLPVVITLREADHWPERNSNLGAWLKFACELDDVIFVRDTARAFEPLAAWNCEPFETWPEASENIHIRAALYEAARMNMGVSNGPMSLCLLSEWPYRMLTFEAGDYPVQNPENWKHFIGIDWGSQLPWATPEQRIVYKPDTYENIREAYHES